MSGCCPPYRVREVPGMGRGVFASRQINPGGVILEERPLITLDLNDDLELVDGLPVGTMVAKLKSQIQRMDEITSAEILDLHDPSENIRALESEDIDVENERSPNMCLWKYLNGDDVASKMLRIFTCNSVNICDVKEIHSRTGESGLYNHISLVNHSCRPNAQYTWVRDDITKKQVRAMRTIESGEEILTYYIGNNFGSREERREHLLHNSGLLCSCSECSLEGQALEENERLRAEIREKWEELKKILYEDVGTDPIEKEEAEMLVRLEQDLRVLVKKLDIPHEIISQLINFSLPVGICARRLSVDVAPSPDDIKSEVYRYGDQYRYDYDYIYETFAKGR